MVDSINSVGQIQNIQSVKSNTQKNKDTSETENASAPVDAVEISEEALNLAQVEKAAAEAASSLSSDGSLSLSVDPERLNALV